jgi:hypothetical protein
MNLFDDFDEAVEIHLMNSLNTESWSLLKIKSVAFRKPTLIEI